MAPASPPDSPDPFDRCLPPVPSSTYVPISMGSSWRLAASECPTSSKSSVASRPAACRMISSPPGWSSRNSVTSYTFPCITSQQLSSELCSLHSVSVISLIAKTQRIPVGAASLAVVRGVE